MSNNYAIYAGKIGDTENVSSISDKLRNILKMGNTNIGLFLNKYIQWKKYSNNNHEINLRDQIKYLTLTERDEEQRTEKTQLKVKYFPVDQYLSFKKRFQAMMKTLESMGYNIKYLNDGNSELKLNWRLAINLGATNVYETSIALHRNYSIPYIPGSAIKGVTRHWAILKLANKIVKNEKILDIKTIMGIIENISMLEIEGETKEHAEDLISDQIAKVIKNKSENKKEIIKKIKEKIDDNLNEIKEIQEIFGTQNRKGEVIFFDAIPIVSKVDIEKGLIALDIINVHYKDYYQREGKIMMPGDWMDPTPILFLAVEKDIKFDFILASKANITIIEKAAKLTKEALLNHGIGAKTAVGYGYFYT